MCKKMFVMVVLVGVFAGSASAAYIAWEPWNNPDDLNWQHTGFNGITSTITTNAGIGRFEIVGDDPTQPGYNGLAKQEVVGTPAIGVDVSTYNYLQIAFTGASTGADIDVRVVAQNGAPQAPWLAPTGIFVWDLTTANGGTPLGNLTTVELYMRSLTGTPLGTYADMDFIYFSDSATPIPEPATMFLMALGGIAALRRKR